MGYADQVEEEWKPAGYAMQFPGLTENYRKVCEPGLGCEHNLYLTNWCHLVSQNMLIITYMAIWETMFVYEISQCLLTLVLFSSRKLSI